MKTKVIVLFFCLFMVLSALGQTPAIDLHWDFIWGDDFDSSFVDENIWMLPSDSYKPKDKSLELLLRSNIYTDSGNLVLRAKRENNMMHIDYNNDTTYFNYSSGEVDLQRYYQNKYGYIESRIKLPYGKGYFPAFWTWAPSYYPHQNAGEIDIFEMVGGKYPSTVMGTNMHAFYCEDIADTCKNQPNVPYLGQLCPNCDPNILNYHQSVNIPAYTDYHVYAVEWNPSKIIWYVDGKVVRNMENPGIVDYVMIILNFAIYPHDPLYEPDENTPFPAYMYVDYIKVYQLKEDKTGIINECNYNFDLYDNLVKRNITIGGSGCSNSINNGDTITLRAAEFIEINGDFTVPLGAEFYMDVNEFYE